jgi:hypothetical protein
MRKKKAGAIAIKSFALLVVLGAAHLAMARQATTTYPNMAPINQYLMTDQGAEMALARSAAPESISRDAEVLILGRHGFETAVNGKNGVAASRTSMNCLRNPAVVWTVKNRGAPIRVSGNPTLGTPAQPIAARLPSQSS